MAIPQTTVTHPLDGDEVFPILWPKVNDNFKAVMTLFLSDDASEPAVNYPGQLFHDVSAGYVKIRNLADDGYLVIGKAMTASPVAPPVLGELGCYITKDSEGDEGANIIRFSIQVGDVRADANMDAVAGERPVLVIVSATSNGAPGGTGTSAVGSAGQVLQELTAETVLLCQTDSTGLLEIDVTETGAKSLYVRAACGQGQFTELQGTWA